MKILFLPGNHKFPYMALKLLYNKNNVEIVGCVIDSYIEYFEKMSEFCKEHGITILTTQDLYDNVKNLNFEIAYSVFYPKIIKEPVIENCKIACINFHPAPLPQYRGVASMCFGVLNQVDYWEITAHFIEDETLDTGKVIMTKRIAVEQGDTPYNIEEKLYRKEIEIFEDVTNLIVDNQLQNVGAHYPEGEGKYYSKKDYIKARNIDLKQDTGELIAKKVKAFWFPKTAGVARIELDGKEFGLVDMEIMQEIRRHYVPELFPQNIDIRDQEDF